jgi:hypothetical protein
MSFDVFVIRDDEADDPAMYPVLGDEPDTVALALNDVGIS